MEKKSIPIFRRQKMIIMAAAVIVLLAVLFLIGRDTLFAYGSRDPYYITNKTIVIKNAYDAAFDVKTYEDGGDREWDYSWIGKYVPAGTVIRRNPKSNYSEYHSVVLDGLEIRRDGNDQRVIFYCDTSGTTPYLRLGKSARTGYTLTGVNVTGNGNAGTTTVSNGDRVGNFEDTTVDTSLDHFTVYAGATSTVSELTCYWQPNEYDLYLNPLSRDGIQGYINGTDPYGNGPTCINTTGNTLITVGANLVYGTSNWHNVSGYPASRDGYEFLGWEDQEGRLVYDANGECTREGKYFDANGNYCYTENLYLFAKYKASDHNLTVRLLFQNADGSYPQPSASAPIWINNIPIEHGKDYDFWGFRAADGTPDNPYWNIVHVFGTMTADTTIYVKVPRIKYPLYVHGAEGVSSTSGTGWYAWGSKPTIDATLKEGYDWSKWTGTYELTDKRASFEMPIQEVHEYAQAPLKTCTVKVYLKLENADGSYASPTLLSTNRWNYGYNYNIWVYGNANGPDNPYYQNTNKTGTVKGDENIYINVPRIKYRVTLNKGAGISSVSGSGTYRWGQTVTARASVSNGYSWNGWTGTLRRYDNPYTFEMPAQNVSLTANTINNPPSNVSLSAKKGGTVLATATQYTSSSVSGWQNSSIGLALSAYDPGDGLKKLDIYRNDTGALVASKTYNGAKSTTTLTGTDNIEGTVTFHGVATDMAGQTTSTKDLTIKVDTKAPVVTTFNIQLGTYAAPVDTLHRSDGRINTNAYGAKINIIARDTNGSAAGGSGDVSKIRKAYIEVTDPAGINPSRIYTLYDDYRGCTTFTDTTIINVIRDFPRSIDLNYTLHMIDNAGNEYVETKSAHREMEVYISIERTTENGNTTNLTSNQFRGGYEGVVHIVTTGWVDSVTLAWPQDILDARDIDAERNAPTMEYNVTIDMNSETNPEIILKDDNDGSFTRCYDFHFWIPIYMEDITGDLGDNTIQYSVIGTGTRGDETKSHMAPFFVGNGSVLNDIRSVIIQ